MDLGWRRRDTVSQPGQAFKFFTQSRPPRTSTAEYKPILEEVEKLLAEAGLDEDEMKTQGARDVAHMGVDTGQSRNRR